MAEASEFISQKKIISETTHSIIEMSLIKLYIIVSKK